MYTGLHVKYPLFLSDFNKTRISQQIFETRSDMKFHKNSATGSRVVPHGQIYGRTDGHDEANNRFSQFCERAQNGMTALTGTVFFF
jgi:hypothetical protein